MIRRPDAQPRGQGGFALVTVLGVIALTAVVIGALLGLAFTTLRVTSEQEQSARALRAADSAVESAIAQMRTRPGPDLQDPCSVAAPGFLDTIDFGGTTTETTDDLSVSLDCTAGGVGSSTNTEDQVRLVGADGYQGGIVAPGPAGSLVPSLVHDGSTGLRFDSGVVARRSASVRSSDPAGPAVATAGEYAQGDTGPGSTGAEPCGTLAPGLGPNDGGAIVDLDIAPSCDDATAENVVVNDPQAVAGFEVTDADPAVPAGCAPVVQIQPGRYDSGRSAELNQRLNGCPGATFHFLPGVFSFDVNDAAASAADRHALRFGDASATYVAGVLAAGPGAADPAAVRCDTSQSGATFVLSGRTEIRHSAGRLAICPAFSPSTGDPLPAIYQQTSVPTGITAAPPVAEPLPRTFTFNCTFSSPCSGSPPAKTRTHRIELDVSGSRPLTSLKVLVTGTEGDTTPNNLVRGRDTLIEVRRASDNFQLCSTGWMTGTPNGGLASSFELLTGECAGDIDNEADLTGYRLWVRHRMTLANIAVSQPLSITDVDVLVAPAAGSVAGAGVSAAEGSWTDLAGAAAAGGAAANPQVGCPHLVCVVAEPDGSRSPDEPFRHALALTDFDVDVPTEYASRGVDPTLSGLQVLVDLQPSSSTLPPEVTGGPFFLQPQFFRPEMAVTATLTTASGQRCRTENGYVNSDHQIALDLFDADAGAGGCNAVLESYSQLQGADLTLAFDMPCVRNPTALWQCLSLGSGSSYEVARTRPPAVAHVALGLTTDDYNGPPPTSTLTVDTTTGATTSDPHVAGDVWMPAGDLDLNWAGDAWTGERPLIAGDLVLNGLASTMSPGATMGIVCCDATRPDTRTVRITASVGGQDRLAVTVRFNDIDPDPATGGYSPGHSVDVLDWTSCRGATCTPAAPPDP